MFIAVSGSIGAGKSTVTRIYAEIFKYKPVFETVANHPYLERFYADQEKYAFQTQVFFLWDRFNKHYTLEKSCENLVADRCIYEDAIFAKVLNQRGILNDEDFYKTYMPHYKLLCEILKPPDLMIYLRASVDTLMYRIGKRSRDMEKSIERSYIEMLSNAYEEWIANYPHKKLIVETDGLDLTCDLNTEWFYLVKAIHNKVLNNDLPNEAIGLPKLLETIPCSCKKSNAKWEREKIFCAP